MSKFALTALTHGVRREGRDAGIRATVICPGYVATDMTANETEIPRHDMTQPGDLAEMVEMLDASRQYQNMIEALSTAKQLMIDTMRMK